MVKNLPASAGDTGEERSTPQSGRSPVSGATLGITDKMEAQPQPPPLILQAWTRDEELGLVILTCSFLSLVELAGKNVKVLERSMRKQKPFAAQEIIYKITIDICSRIFTKIGCSLRP